MKVGIIGAGPAGLTCAAKLVESGIEVDVFESDSKVGGMTKSFEMWGQVVDLGPHRFFSMDDKINDFWLSQVGEDYIQVDRLTRIYYNKKFFLYPVRAVNALSNLGLGEAMLCILSYLKALFKKKGEEKTFEEWVSNQFGYKLYSIFFKSYSERLWGIPCSELDADFARQRIKGLNMLEVIKGALFHTGAGKHKTLVDKFAYPKMGAGVPYENLARKIEEQGSKIYLNTLIKGIHTEGSVATGIELMDGTIMKYDYIVSTAPFTEMICSIPEIGAEERALASSLKYRNTTLVYLEIEGERIFEDNWIYVHDKNVQMGRITNFQNWSPYMVNGNKNTILVLEYWSYDNDKLWNYSDEQMIQLASKELVSTGLVKEGQVKRGNVVRMHRSYPVYDMGYQDKMVKLQKAADSISHLYFIGRNGSFKYNNQDHSILMGILAAENIIKGENVNNLWAVNTDYDYQEGKSSLLDEKGQNQA